MALATATTQIASRPVAQNSLFSQLAREYKCLPGTGARIHFVKNRIFNQEIAAEFLKQGVSKQSIIQKLLAEKIYIERLAFEAASSGNVTYPPALKMLVFRIRDPALRQSLIDNSARTEAFRIRELIAEGIILFSHTDLIEEFFEAAEKIAGFIYHLPLDGVAMYPEDAFIVRLFAQNFQHLHWHIQAEVANDPRCDSSIAREFLTFSVPNHEVQRILASKLDPFDAETIIEDRDVRHHLYEDCKAITRQRANQTE